MGLSVIGGTSSSGKVLKEKTFYSSDTWTVPAGVTEVDVTVAGAGGWTYVSSSTYAAPAAGGVIRKKISVTPLESIPVTIGASISRIYNIPNPGGGSSFGNYLYAWGGEAGAANVANTSTPSYASGAVADLTSPRNNLIKFKDYVTFSGYSLSGLNQALGNDSTGYYATWASNTLAYAPNLSSSWTTKTSVPGGSNYYKFRLGNSLIISFYTSSTTAYYSSNQGSSWSTATLPFYPQNIQCVNGVWFVFSNTSGQYAYSTNFTSWTSVSSNTGYVIYNVAYLNGKYVMMSGAGGTAYHSYSSDYTNSTWTNVTMSSYSLTTSSSNYANSVVVDNNNIYMPGAFTSSLIPYISVSPGGSVSYNSICNNYYYSSIERNSTLTASNANTQTTDGFKKNDLVYFGGYYSSPNKTQAMYSSPSSAMFFDGTYAYSYYSGTTFKRYIIAEITPGFYPANGTNNYSIGAASSSPSFYSSNTLSILGDTKEGFGEPYYLAETYYYPEAPASPGRNGIVVVRWYE